MQVTFSLVLILQTTVYHITLLETYIFIDKYYALNISVSEQIQYEHTRSNSLICVHNYVYYIIIFSVIEAVIQGIRNYDEYLDEIYCNKYLTGLDKS